MPLPLAVALSSASSIVTPVAFDWITIMITSLSSALVSGTGGFFIARSFSKKSDMLPNQGEKTLSEVSILLDQTAHNTQNIHDRLSTTDVMINKSVCKLDKQLNILSENNEQATITQTSLNSVVHRVNCDDLEQSGIKLEKITTGLDDSHQILHKQQIAFADTIEQLKIIGQQYQVDQTKIADLTNTFTYLLQQDTTAGLMNKYKAINETLTQYVSELKQEKDINQELYTTLEALLSENDRLKKILHTQEESQIKKTSGIKMFN